MQHQVEARQRSLSAGRRLLRLALIGAGGVAVSLLGGLPLRGATATERPLPVVDLHVDLPYRHLFKNQPFATGLGEFRADQLQAAGLVGVVFPLFVPEWASPRGARLEDYERSYDVLFRRVLETPPYSLPGCGVLRAGEGGARPVQTWLAFEGAAHLENRRDVASWALRGIRSFGLVHTSHNALATSSGAPIGKRSGSRDPGLSDRGRQVAEAVFEMDGLIDVSHASDAATDAIIQLAGQRRGVVIASHSNARALAAHPRNLTDAQIRGIAQTGGVVGINFHQSFLSSSGRASLKQVVEQIRYVSRIAGIQHVALGSDYEGGIRPVPELRDASRYQVLARALLAEGWSTAEVRAVLAENALRVLCEAPRSGAAGALPAARQ